MLVNVFRTTLLIQVDSAKWTLISTIQYFVWIIASFRSQYSLSSQQWCSILQRRYFKIHRVNGRFGIKERFIFPGMLICFGRPSYLRRVSNKMTDSSTTPRSLFVNQNYNSNLGSHNLAVSSSSTPYGIIYPPVAQSISSFYNQDRVSY